MCENAQALAYIHVFRITVQEFTRLLANFYGQYADRDVNLKFIQHVSEQGGKFEKNKLISVFNASISFFTITA